MNSASQDIRSATAPGAIPPKNTRDFPRLVTVGGRRIDYSPLICRWLRDTEGRLSCGWTRIPDRPQSS